MYFWRLEQLKTEMAARPLTDREVLPYLVIYAASIAVTAIPSPTFNLWDGLTIAASLLLAVFGTIYIYRQNGGGDGERFLQRYFAIGWVVTVRWIVAMTVAALAFYGTLEAIGISSESTDWHHLLFFAIVEAILYWRIGYHVRDLAQRTPAA